MAISTSPDKTTATLKDQNRGIYVTGVYPPDFYLRSLFPTLTA